MRKSWMTVAALSAAFVLAAGLGADAAPAKKAVKKAAAPQKAAVWQAPGAKPGPEGAMQRTVAFVGDPIVVNARVNRGTLLRMPGEPILIQMGRPEDFSVEVSPEMKYVMVKPLTPMSASNVFVTTKTGLYLFFFYAEDEPEDFRKTRKPFDMVLTVTDPHRQNRLDDVQSLVWMAFHGRKMDDMTLVRDAMSSPASSVFVTDPVIGVGLKATLMRVHFLPAERLCTYWVRFENLKTAKLNLKSHDQTYALDEKTVRTPGLLKVAVPNVGGRSVPLMAVGDKLDMFLVTRTEQVPSVLKVRFALQGSRTLPMEASFPTRGATYRNMDKAQGGSPEFRKLVEEMNTKKPAGPQEILQEGNDYVIDSGNVPSALSDTGFTVPDVSLNTEKGASGAPAVIMRPDAGGANASGSNVGDDIVFD